LMADCTWSKAVTILVPQAKLTDKSAEPRLLVDRIFSTPGSARNTCSKGYVTSITILSTGLSPESTVTKIRGKEMFGKSATGNLNAVKTPPNVRSAKKNNSEARCRCSHGPITVAPFVKPYHLLTHNYQLQLLSHLL
jgi:hypothetical protein